MSSAGPSVTDPPARSLLRVTTSNPFYVVSAGLFLLGLRLSFADPGKETDTWALMGGLAGYTLLLAAAAFFLVRFAGVWDDVRTVLLLVVLMFLATSVTFDELLVLDFDRGAGFNLAGLGFAIALTEFLLRGLRLRLPILFRLPYHLTVTLFFLYPVALASLARDPHSEALLWGLWGFAPAAGLVFLTLLPAARRGPGLVAGTSPWPWPFYPWSVFVFLAVAVCGRAWLLCWSFHLLPGATSGLIFGPHFLVPFGLAVAAVVLEIGLASGSRPTRWVALAAPLALAALAGVGHRPDAVYAEFLAHFTARFGGTPLFAALLAAAGFHLYAWVRGVPLAPEGLTAALAALSAVRPDTLALADAAESRPAFLAAAVLVQVWVGLVRRDGWRLVLCGLAGAVAGGALACREYARLRGQFPGLDFLVIGLALLPVAVLVTLGKSGFLRRWAAGRRGRVPGAAE